MASAPDSNGLLVPSPQRIPRPSSLRSASAGEPNTINRRLPRTKTLFRIAHPPPIARSKKTLRIRPRILLQLHQHSEGSRSLPVLDVLPSSIFAPRLATRFPRIFKGKSSLGWNDLIIVSNHFPATNTKDSDVSTISSDDSAWEYREVIGTICHPSRSDGADDSRAEIRLDQGFTWEATSLRSGGYEFNATNSDGSYMKVRWVPRNRSQTGRQHSNTSADLRDQRPDLAQRFTFSVISPGSRRHPVIASMTSSTIEIQDQYPASVPPKLPNSPASLMSTNSSYFEPPENSTEAMIRVDHHLRSLIMITGIHVLFREGWAVAFAGTPYKSRRAQTTQQPTSAERSGTTTKKRGSSLQLFRSGSKSLRGSAERQKEKSMPSLANSAEDNHLSRVNQSTSSSVKPGVRDSQIISAYISSKDSLERPDADDSSDGSSDASSSDDEQEDRIDHDENNAEHISRGAQVPKQASLAVLSIADTQSELENGSSGPKDSYNLHQRKGPSLHPLGVFRRCFSLSRVS